MKGFSKLQWMDVVRQCTEIPAEQRLVIEDIGSTADQDGVDAWRDNKAVAERLKVHTRTVTRARESATRHGLWVETRPADNKHTARYRLTVPTAGGDCTVNRGNCHDLQLPDALGVTPQSNWGDSTVTSGRQHSPVGVTPLSTASGITSGSSSGPSSVDPWAPRPGEEVTVDGEKVIWQGEQSA